MKLAQYIIMTLAMYFGTVTSGYAGDQKTIVGGFKSVSGMDSETGVVEPPEDNTQLLQERPAAAGGKVNAVKADTITKKSGGRGDTSADHEATHVVQQKSSNKQH